MKQPQRENDAMALPLAETSTPADDTLGRRGTGMQRKRIFGFFFVVILLKLLDANLSRHEPERKKDESEKMFKVKTT